MTCRRKLSFTLDDTLYTQLLLICKKERVTLTSKINQLIATLITSSDLLKPDHMQQTCAALTPGELDFFVEMLDQHFYQYKPSEGK